MYYQQNPHHLFGRWADKYLLDLQNLWRIFQQTCRDVNENYSKNVIDYHENVTFNAFCYYIYRNSLLKING